MNDSSRTLLLVAALLAPCCSRGPAEIVVISPASGALAAQGAEIRRGVDLAAARLERTSPGLLRVRHVDDGSVASRCLDETRRALDAGALAVISGAGGDSFRDLAAALGSQGRAVVCPWAGAERPAGSGPDVFRMSVRGAAAMERLARHARREMFLKDLVVLHEDTATGRELAAAFAAELESQRGLLEWSRAFPVALEESALPAVADDLRTRPGQGVLIIGSARDTALIVAHARSLSYVGRFLGTDAVALLPPDAATARTLEGLAFASAMPRGGLPAADAFAAAYRGSAGGADPTLLAALGHDALVALAAGIDAAGGAWADKLAPAMRGVRFSAEGALGSVRFDAAGDAARDLGVFVLQDGVVLPWAASTAAKDLAPSGR